MFFSANDMYAPITDMTNGLIWTREGTAWAIWRVTRPLSYMFQDPQKKAETRQHHTALYRALGGESLHLGLIAGSDPAAIVAAMAQDVDTDAYPQWASECLATLDYLEQIPIGHRAYFVAAPLPNPGRMSLSEPLWAAATSITDVLAMPRPAPCRKLEFRRAQAEILTKALPDPFGARLASVAEITWIFSHALDRGLNLDGLLPETADYQDTTTRYTGKALPPFHLDPAGRTDLNRPLDPITVLRRPFVKVTNAARPESPSYQTTLAMASVPSAGVAFPGGEWLGRLDESGENVDWAIRMTVRSGREVTARNRRAVQTLADQTNQREGEARAGNSLGQAGEALAEYQTHFDNDELEVEVDATALFTVAGPTHKVALDSAKALAKYYERMGFGLRADTAAQVSLWKACLPGYPTSRVVREYAHIAPSVNFAASIAMITSELGSSRGTLFSMNIGNGNSRVHPILLDLGRASTKMSVALAIAFVGELGAGKSVAMKTVALAEVDRGAYALVVDHTQMGEWCQALGDIDGVQIGDLSEFAKISFDPIRFLPPAASGRITRKFLQVMLALPTRSPQNALLGKVLHPQYMHEHEITSLARLYRHLQTDCLLPGAKELADAIGIYTELEFAKAFFDDELPALNPDARAIVLRVHKLQLPSKAELDNSHLFEQLPAEKVFGRAVFALIASFAKYRCFSDENRLDLFVNDEFSKTMSSPEAAAEIYDFLTDGRKHQACLIAGSHDAQAHFGDNPVLRRLIAFRVVMRHRDPVLAARNLRWLQGLEDDAPVDPALVKLISEQTSPVVNDEIGVLPDRRGECLLRDFEGRIGRAKVMMPRRPARAVLVGTTPTTSAGKARAAVPNGRAELTSRPGEHTPRPGEYRHGSQARTQHVDHPATGSATP